MRTEYVSARCHIKQHKKCNGKVDVGDRYENCECECHKTKCEHKNWRYTGHAKNPQKLCMDCNRIIYPDMDWNGEIPKKSG